jgi:hypothetical protein
VLPNFPGSPKDAIYAVYPCREFMPAKVNAFIDFYANILEKDLNPAKNLKAVDSGKTAAVKGQDTDANSLKSVKRKQPNAA